MCVGRITSENNSLVEYMSTRPPIFHQKDLEKVIPIEDQVDVQKSDFSYDFLALMTQQTKHSVHRINKLYQRFLTSALYK